MTQILLLSLGISLLIKFVGPLLQLSSHSPEVLVIVLSPSIVLGLVLFSRR